MTTKIKFTYLLVAFSILFFTGCASEETPGPAGQDGQDATVYYSEWFYTTEWLGESGDWYFTAPAPDLTENIVEGGVILVYAWLADDIYEGNTVRPLPAFAVGANWSFLIQKYGEIEITCDMVNAPKTEGNSFRFIAIPGTVTALKSASGAIYSKQQLEEMTYQEVCGKFGITQ